MGSGKPDGTSVANSERTFQLGPFAAMFRSFRYRDFALFWTGNFLSNVGTWMQNLALGWLILVRTNSPFLLGLNGFLGRSEEHTSELQSRLHLVCRLLLEKKKKKSNVTKIS